MTIAEFFDDLLDRTFATANDLLSHFKKYNIPIRIDGFTVYSYNTATRRSYTYTASYTSADRIKLVKNK